MMSAGLFREKPKKEWIKHYDGHMKVIVSMLDVFDGKLSLDDILEKDLPLLEDLYLAQIEYLKEKAKAEREYIEKSRNKEDKSPKTKTI
jgi:hypothetical protein